MECIICKGEKIRQLYAAYLECLTCGLIFLKHMPSKSELISRYVSGQISPIKYYESTKFEDTKTFEKRLKLIQKFTKGKNLLDIGCNIGTLLEVAEKAGFDARGVDINFMCREYGKQKGLKIDNVIDDELPYSRPFDVIVMNDLIEHVSDPVAYLKMVKNHLKPNGVVFIATPDAGSFMRKIFGERWVHFKPSEHLWYFNISCFNELVLGLGFEVLLVKHLPRYRSIKTIIERGQRYIGPLLNWVPFNNSNISFNLCDEFCVVLKNANNI